MTVAVAPLLRELYDEFSPLVYGLAARVTRDWAAAEDISQEVFVRVWNDLPAPQREAIRLAYFDGQTYRQVAETLGIPEGTAKSRLRLGLRQLAARLEGEGIEP